MQGLGKLKNKEINYIPNNTEKYIYSPTINLSKNGGDMFPILHRYVESDHGKVPTWIV
jgi:hypothetical protein